MESGEAISNADRALTECAKRIRLFYHLAPENEAGERARFFERDGRSRQPDFSYRPLEFSAEAALRELDTAPVDEIEDTALRGVYEKKRWEIERQIGLLEARGNADFLERSLELFGRPPSAMAREAKRLLAESSWVEDRNLDTATVRKMLEDHVASYRRRHPDFDCEVVVADAMSAKMYVHDNRIHLRRGARYSRDAALADTVHEIDAHVLTYLNGRRQPLDIFEVGPCGTLAFQESLGVFTEIANGVMFPGRVVGLAARVMAVDAMADGAEFSEVFDQLARDHGLDDEEAFQICVRVWRGGGFTKDWLYVAELERIFRYWASRGDMEMLLLAKVTMDTLDEVRDLVARGELHRARFLPAYLERISPDRPSDEVRALLQCERIALGDLLTVNLGP